MEEDGTVRLVATENDATWGIDRIDQHALPLSTTFSYASTGSGVTAYIIDTGIRFSHAEFGGRAPSGVDEVNGGSADDCNGHGTHVAGTVGGATYGVAKQVSLVAVRVLNCLGAGTNAMVIAGIDWVTGDHAPGAPAVANMSLGSTYTLTGTSMAAPHTTGVAALYLESNPGATPAQVQDALYAKTIKGIVGGSRTGNNHLLFTDY